MKKISRQFIAWFNRYRVKLGSYLYIGMAILSLGGLIFFMASRAIFVDDSPINDSGLGLASEQIIGNAKVQIVQRQINSKTGYGEILMEVNESTSDSVGKKYLAKIGQVSKDGHHETVLPAALKKISEHYYVLQFKQLKSNWHRLRIDFGQVNKSQLIAGKDYGTLLKNDDQVSHQTANQAKNIQQKPFDLDYRKTPKSKVAGPSKTSIYLAQGLTLDLKSNEKKIITVKHDLNKGHQQVNAMQKKIRAIQADEAYQTDADIHDSKTQIDSINGRYQGNKKDHQQGQKCFT